MRNFFRLAVVAIVWVPMFLVAAGLARGGPEDFSGFEISSKATAALFTFDSPSLGVPAKPTGELNFAFSEASLRSGPSGYGLGSIAWPGQVAAGLPSFLQGEIERQSGQQIPTDLPNYPVRAETFHPQGPPSASMEVGTMRMSSRAGESGSEGVAYLNAFAFPGVGTMGNQSSMSSSGFDPEGAVAMTEASVSDVSFFSGVVKFDSVVSRVTARSDGEKGSVAGGTTIVGAEIAGTRVVIDSSGVRVADQEGLGAATVQQAVNQVLAQTGISIELSEPVDTVQGAQASRALGGVLIRGKSSILEPFLSALPDELEGQIRGQLTLDQEFTIQIAPAAASAVAAKTLEFPVEVPDLGSAPVDSLTGGGGDVTGAAPDSPGVSTAEAPSVGGGSPVAVAPASIAFGGVPVGLVVVLMIAAFVSSRPLMAVADRILSARAVAGCPDARS